MEPQLIHPKATFSEDAPKPIKSMLIIGAGYVGAPTAAIFAKHCPSLRVVVADIDGNRIAAWNSQTLPFFEPGLEAVVREVRDRNLFFTTDVAKSISEADIIMIAVNTPSKYYGALSKGYDLSAFEKVCRTIAINSKGPTIIVEKSTVPVRTSDVVKRICQANGTNSGVSFTVLSNPEFMAEGTAIRDLEFPSRVLIGGDSTPEGEKALRQLKSLYKNWVPEKFIVTTKLYSAELTKLAANAFLAQRVSSINALSSLCEETGADVREVSKVVGMDSRIGSKFLQPGVGFGGSCFGKDLRGLIYLCESFHLDTEAKYWQAVLDLNEHQKARFSKQVIHDMFGSVKGKKVTVLGFAFKADTSDTRESPAIQICRDLAAEGARLTILDPKVTADSILSLVPSAIVNDDIYQACWNSHALLLLTPWKEFRLYDYAQLYRTMVKPAFLFDGRGLLHERHRELTEIGFNVQMLGEAPLSSVALIE